MFDFNKIIANQKRDLEKLFAAKTIARAPVDNIDLMSPCAQVVIGIRRCGKSVLCRMALQRHPELHYGYVDFDDEKLKSVTAEDLDDILKAVYVVYGEIQVLFLDEIQNVEGWELFVNRLLRGGLHLLITGSNSKLLSSELATHLTGRHIATELFAFSFTEYRRWLGRGKVEATEDEAELRRDYDRYFENGGLPETFVMADVNGYLSMLYESILSRDIIGRHRLRSPAQFSRVARVVMESYAQEVSFRNLARQLEITNVRTVQNYIDYMERAYLVQSLKRYSTKRAERTKIGKVYAIDPGFITHFTGVAESDESRGRRLENIVYLQLRTLRKALDSEIYYYQDGRHEIDFAIVHLGKVVQLIQVSYSVESAKTRERELSALFDVGGKLNCKELILITDHENGEEKRGDLAVRIVDAPSWLMEKKSVPKG